MHQTHKITMKGKPVAYAFDQALKHRLRLCRSAIHANLGSLYGGDSFALPPPHEASSFQISLGIKASDPPTRKIRVFVRCLCFLIQACQIFPPISFLC